MIPVIFLNDHIKTAPLPKGYKWQKSYDTATNLSHVVIDIKAQGAYILTPVVAEQEIVDDTRK